MRDNQPECSFTEIKDGACIINLDEYSDIRIHWVALYVNNNNNNNDNNNNNNNNNVTYFDSFWVEHIPKQIRAFVNNKNITTNIFRRQAYDSIMCR